MVQATLPLPDHDFEPHLTELQPRNLTWKGHIVQWVRNCEHQGPLYFALIKTVAIIVSAILLATVIFTPVVFILYGEYIIQGERDYLEKTHKNLVKEGMDQCRNQLLRGRVHPLLKINQSLPNSMRKQIIKDLELSKEEASKKTDQELFLAAALKFDDFISRYHIEVRFRSQSFFWRLINKVI